MKNNTTQRDAIRAKAAGDNEGLCFPAQVRHINDPLNCATSTVIGETWSASGRIHYWIFENGTAAPSRSFRVVAETI